ncbi:MCE family protein [Allosaccharopolyspora coralli]|uniref:MCE family protein n=1 Tax=Allosaccharopolyspora coralli TaxID=2665642 RepID=A0A5Q3QFV8_9PSEU|nr:MCE family protein [Allosaccharopolyspora coralli]QGK70349.1 MCE family protein [Allosaccharopolyspora coralli]
MKRTVRVPATRWLVVGCVLALLVSAGLWWVGQMTGTRVTAYVDKAVGLYQGSAVRVLGIQVGTIESVAPKGEVVQLDLRVDEGVDIPAEAKAVVVAPSLVSDRYVQLTPAYADGPVMASGAVISKEHTVTPAELDDLYRSANALTEALGPQGANDQGALSALLDTGAANLEGNGENLNTTVQRLGELSSTLARSEGDLFATVENLNTFTATLAQSDAQIRDFYGRTADVTTTLAGQKDQIGASLESLALALGDVERFVRDNRQQLSSNVENLTGVTQALVDQRQALGEVIDIAPTAAANFTNAYDAASGAVAVRGEFNELSAPPVLMVCKLIQASTPRPIPPELTETCEELEPVLSGAVPLPSVNETVSSLQQGELPPLPLPVLENLGSLDGAPAEDGPR